VKNLSAADGTELHLIEWPGGQPSRGTVLVVHGLGEHAARYAWLAEQLAAARWRTAAFDLRGHGRSGGARGAMPAPDSLLEDLGRVIDAVRPPDGQALVLLGHSMGGLIAARFAAESLASAPAAWSRPLSALVLSSPALAVEMSAFQKLLLALGSLAPDRAAGNGLNPEWISRDRSVVKAYEADPLVHDRITPRLARFIVDAPARVLEAAPRWKLPTLLLWAGADRCVAPRGSAAFAAAAPRAIVQSRCFDHLFHEIFNEPEKAEVAAELLQWLSRLSTQGAHR
jgi:alpha-beta hydrolase superfamily lysophospholipase